MRSTSRLVIAASSLFITLAPLSSIRGQVTPSVDDIIAHYVKTVGGMDKIEAIKSIRRVGKYTGDGGFEAQYIQENRRPEFVREDFILQGMTGIDVWDGKSGWKIDPFQGKKDAESLSEDELHGMQLDADFDEPLINYRQKGYKAEFNGMDQVEGTDVYKIKVTLKNGDARIYYLDTEYYVPIKVDDTRIIRGSEQEIVTILGDYKPVNGWMMPFSVESGVKGQPTGKINWEKIEVNVPIDDSRFLKPVKK